jgi:drug/metabolite transporter superfamily protein YnfA
MPKVADLFFKTAIIFLVIGVLIGVQMGISQTHNVAPAHAHINLLGWVTSAIFSVYYALNPAKAQKRRALVHYGIYTAGVIVLTASLFFMLSTDNSAFEALIALGSVITLVGVLVFAWVIFAPSPAVSPLMPRAAAE